MPTCNSGCEPENGYEYTKHNTSWSNNDNLGLMMIGLLLVIILFIVMLMIYWETLSHNDKMIFLGVIGCLLLIFITLIVKRPILFLYMPSSIISWNVSTPEFMDRTVMFPNYKRFEKPESYQKIRSEVDNMLSITRGGNDFYLFANTYGGENTVLADFKKEGEQTKAWRVLNLKLGDTYSDDALTHFPYLVKLLKRTPEIIACMISVLEPGIRIPLHYGYYKGIMRYMLPTHVPKDRENVYLCVNGKKYHWTEGEGVLWDDTYAHKVYNNSNETRVLFFMDVIRPIHPDGNSFLDSFNQTMISLVTGSDFIKDEIKRTERQVKI
jgi:aspartyl/asparaginyl beta-hydroxylase (cupin superfamily)